MRGSVLLCAAVAACASPEPRAGDPVIAVVADHVISTGAVAYDLGFATTGLPMPEHLMFGGADWIANGETCPLESGVGINLYPAFRALASTYGGDPPSSTGATELVVEMSGPAVARVRARWAVDYMCSGHANTASGDTLFTLFPSGRIIRHDEHVIGSDVGLTGASGACGCTGGSSYFLTSSWGFPDTVTNTSETGDALPDPAPGLTRACAIANDHGIAVAWPDDHTRIHPNDSNAWVYDWTNNATAITPGEHELVTRMQLGATGDCAALLAGLATPQLQIAGQPTSVGADGIYEVSGTHAGSFTIETAAMVPAGWAVAVDLGDATHVQVHGSVETAGWYLVQRDPIAMKTLIYFRDALPAGSTIAVEAE